MTQRLNTMSIPSLESAIQTLKEHLAMRESFTDPDLRIVVSPLRVSPLGAGIDYQGGPALSMTVNAYTLLAFIAVKERRVRLYCVNEPGLREFDPGNVKSTEKNDWGRYAMGAAKVISERYGIESGLTGVLYGTLPVSGLGSSSAECLACIMAITKSNNIDPLGWEYTEYVARIYKNYLHSNSGTLDSLSALSGRKDCMLHVDTGSGEVSAHPGPSFGQDYKILIGYTGRAFEGGENDIENDLAECKEVSGFLGIMAGLSSGDKLSEIPPEIYHANSKRLPPNLKLRAEYYFNEASRVQEGLLAWRKGDLEGFGRLMNQSCDAKIDMDKNTDVGLIMLQRVMSASEGVYGSTINGSYVVSFVRNDFGEESLSQIKSNYMRVCPESEGKASFYFAEPEGALRLHD